MRFLSIYLRRRHFSYIGAHREYQPYYTTLLITEMLTIKTVIYIIYIFTGNLQDTLLSEQVCCRKMYIYIY